MDESQLSLLLFLGKHPDELYTLVPPILNCTFMTRHVPYTESNHVRSLRIPLEKENSTQEAFSEEGLLLGTGIRWWCFSEHDNLNLFKSRGNLHLSQLSLKTEHLTCYTHPQYNKFLQKESTLNGSWGFYEVIINEKWRVLSFYFHLLHFVAVPVVLFLNLSSTLFQLHRLRTWKCVHLK